MFKTDIVKFARYAGMVVAITALAGVTWAAFSDKGKITSGTFSVGSSDVKLLQNLHNGLQEGNLVDEVPGPNFTDITPNWTQDYYFKLYNNGSTLMHLVSNANYETANDPDDLRSYIYVEVIEWNDNGDGQFEDHEVGANLGKKTITKWKTEGFDLGMLDKQHLKGYVLRFSTASLSDTKQGKTGKYDFEISAVQI
jgi:predicted ribosomally synthesized peptide with SipW-like signal peptide